MRERFLVGSYSVALRPICSLLLPQIHQPRGVLMIGCPEPISNHPLPVGLHLITLRVGTPRPPFRSTTPAAMIGHQLFLLAELVAALRANNPDLFKRWLYGGIQDLGEPAVTELVLDWLDPFLTVEEQDKLLG